MDLISLALSSGIPRSAAVRAYNLIGGGYYMRLHYSRSPIMEALLTWPRLYKRAIPESHMVEDAVELMVRADIFSIYGTSSSLTGEPLPFSKMEEEVEQVMREIRIRPRGIRMDPIPIPFLEDLAERRKGEAKLPLEQFLKQVAQDSKTLELGKRRHVWLKAIKPEDVLTALLSAGLWDKFLRETKVKVALFLSSRDLIFDRILLSSGVRAAVDQIVSESDRLVEKAKELLETDT
jgi:hypothetical protein